MARSCDGCDDGVALVSVSVLAPTGETITDDSGSAPVLRESLTGALCAACAVGVPSMGALIAAFGGFVDIGDVEDEPESADGLTAAKALREMGVEILSRDADGFTAVIR